MRIPIVPLAILLLMLGAAVSFGCEAEDVEELLTPEATTTREATPPGTPDATVRAGTPAMTPTAATPGRTPEGEATEIEIRARNNQFDKETIRVPAGAQVRIEFNNDDEGIPHNVAVYEDESAARSIFVGEVITGRREITYTFTAPTTPGAYFFRCDVHPTQMTGDFVVTP